MGCSSAREKIESNMLILKLKRVEINQEREEKIKELEKITGKPFIRKIIPDYLDKDGNDDMLKEKNENDKLTINKRRNIKNKKNKSESEENQSSSDSEYSEFSNSFCKYDVGFKSLTNGVVSSISFLISFS